MGPLSINLPTSGAKTTFPMIAEGTWVELRCTDIQGDENEKGGLVKFKFELTHEAPSVESARGEGAPIVPGKPGSKIAETVQLYDKNTSPGDPPPAWAVQKICARIDGLLNTGDPGNKKGKATRPDFNAETVQSMLGKTMMAQMKVKTGEYEGQEIGKILSIEDWNAKNQPKP